MVSTRYTIAMLRLGIICQTKQIPSYFGVLRMRMDGSGGLALAKIL